MTILISFIIGIFFMIQTLNAPIRYFTVFLPYLPSVLMFLLLSFFVFLNNNIYNWILISVLLILSLIGIYHLNNIKQVLFGIYILIPFSFGFIYYKYINWNLIKYIILVCFLIVTISVILNSYINYPWEGAIISVGDYKIDINREWTMEGIKRLAGFTRTSFDAAIQILLYYVLILFLFKNKLFLFILGVLAFISIILTTTKGILLAFIYLVLVILFPKFFLSRVILLLIFFIMIGLPTFSYFYYKNLDDSLIFLPFIGSFFDRIIFTWPNLFEYISLYGNLLFGVGIGGIGAPQSKFDINNYNPADNLGAYLLGMGGIILILLLFFFILFIFVKYKRIYYFNKLEFIIIFLSLIYGFTTNVIENPIFSFLLGYSFHNLLNSKKNAIKIF